MSADMLNVVWPLAFILVVLIAIRQLRSDASPIVKGIVTGLSASAARNAPQYAIAIAFGLSASLTAFRDVFSKLDSAQWNSISWHQYAALWANVLNPFFVAILAYATQSPSQQAAAKANGAAPDNATTPPFPQTPNPDPKKP